MPHPFHLINSDQRFWNKPNNVFFIYLALKNKLIKRGVKEVVKAIRKKTEGKNKSEYLCILACDVSPVDVISHIPILCEKNNIPYIYIKDKHLLGLASGTKKPTCVVLLEKPNKDADE